ncbi:MAG: hypothetical protein IPM98_02750 [Lewinellaceae bacterium]|nr:hypothetical protein [Lewinellaceae bacterium]
MLRSVPFLAFMLLATLLPAQTSFKKRHGTSGDDEARFVEVLSDNSFIVAGSSTGGGLGGQDAMLVKFSADGTVEWSKAFGGSGNEFFTKIFACSDGNYIAVGETNSFGAGNVDIYVVKFGATGNMVWERTCGGSSAETARGVCEVSDGYIITGGTQSFGAGFWDISVNKLDLSGNSVWSRVWGSGGGDIAGYVLPGSNDEIWISGFVFVGSNNHDGILLRLNAGGTLLSAIRIGGSGNEGCSYLTPGGAGMTGSSSTWTYTNGSQLQPWMLSFNTSGGLVWAKRYLLPSGNYEINAEDCPDGGFIFSPTNVSNDTGDAYLVKTDGSGNISWAKTHPYIGNGRMYHARPSPDGGYVAVGYSSGSGRDMFILKTDAVGHVADCCPTDAPITAAAITPATPSTSPNGTDGPAAGTPAGQDQAVGLNEVNICNGPPCCITDAGSMLAQTLSVCINQPATFTHNNDEVLDGNDLLEFILASNPGDLAGSIILRSNTPAFTFDPATMQTGQIYYIAAIAGNNLNGNVDLNDPCVDISNAAQLIWRPLPEVSFSTDTTDVCPGNCRIIFAAFTGTPPFTLTIDTPAGPASYTFSTNSGSFQICPPAGTPPGSFQVQATGLTDAFCACN